jgi:hypothetical protein
MDTAFNLLTAVILLEASALIAIAVLLDKTENFPMYHIMDTPAGKRLMKTGYICGTVYTVIHGYILWIP